MTKIKPFQPMLSARLKEDGNGQYDFSTLKFPVIASPKIDGIRLVIKHEKALTRKLKALPNTFIRDELERLLSEYELDGELYKHGTPFNTISSEVMSFEGEPNFEYHVFDLIAPELSYIERLNKLLQLNLQGIDSRIKILPTQVINNLDELFQYETKMVDLGYEGVMIRDPNGLYKYGRSTLKEQGLIKITRFSEEEAIILDFIEEMKNTNEKEVDERGYSKRSSKQEGKIPSGKLGTLIATRHKNEDGSVNVDDVFEVGSGFTHEHKKEIWENRNKYVGKLITVRYRELNEYGTPRFSSFKGFRKDLE